MAKKRYMALVGLAYPLNPDAPREQWEWKEVEPGTVVDDLPAGSIPHLLKGKQITDLERDQRELPADFPARSVLVDAGMTTIGQVERRYDELLSIKGIGDKTVDAIREALLIAETGEGGDDGAVRE